VYYQHKTHYMTIGRELDSYTISFTARKYETDFYTYCVFRILQTIKRDLTKAKSMSDYEN